jgi:hypothetical protein
MNHFRPTFTAGRWKFLHLLTEQNLRRLLNSSELHAARLVGRDLIIQSGVNVDAVAVCVVTKSLMLSKKQLDCCINTGVIRRKLNWDLPPDSSCRWVLKQSLEFSV